MRNLAFQPRGPPAGQNLHCPGQQPRQCSCWLDYIRSQEASTVAWSLGWDLEWVIPLYTHDGLADGSPKAPLLSSALSSSQALPSWDIPTCWSSMANLQKCSCCLCRFFFLYLLIILRLYSQLWSTQKNFLSHQKISHYLLASHCPAVNRVEEWTF